MVSEFQDQPYMDVNDKVDNIFFDAKSIFYFVKV